MSDSFQHMLQELRREYALTLPKLVHELLDAASHAERTGDRERALFLAHQLAGTAGSYGFRNLSEAVRSLEDALEGRPGPSPDEAAAAVRAALATIEAPS